MNSAPSRRWRRCTASRRWHDHARRHAPAAYRDAIANKPCAIRHRSLQCATLLRGGAVWQLVGLITRRSQVQILPPLPHSARTKRRSGQPHRRFRLCFRAVRRIATGVPASGVSAPAFRRARHRDLHRRKTHGAHRSAPRGRSRKGLTRCQANAAWHQAISGFQNTPSASSTSALTPNTTRSRRSSRGRIASPTGSSKYMTLMTRR